ncbi:MAG: hypothetical protein P8X55_04375 [Desulfosarcinaceae bacterium]
MEDKLKQYVGNLITMIRTAQSVDGNDNTRDSMRKASTRFKVQDTNAGILSFIGKAPGRPSLRKMELQDALCGDAFQSWTVDMGVYASAGVDAAGEAGVAMRCSDSAESAWYWSYYQ